MQGQNTFNKNDVIQAMGIYLENTATKEVYEQAQKYLNDFEKSPNSWGQIIEILQDRSLRFSMLVEAAVILKHKLQFDFTQLPQDEQLNLAQILFKILVEVEDTAITNQVNETISYLYLFCFQKIGNILEIIEKTLSQVEGKEMVILDLLKCVGDNAYSKQVVADPENKEAFREYLHTYVEEGALLMLHNASLKQNLRPAVVYKILDAFKEWVYFNGDDDRGHKLLMQNNCFKLALEGMFEPVISEISKDILVLLMTNNKVHRWKELYELIFSYLPRYTTKCKEVSKDDRDHAADFVMVFTRFASRFIPSILNRDLSNEIHEFMKFLLELTKTEEDYALENLEDFWNDLSRDFNKLAEKEKEGSCKILEPFYNDLLEIACQRMMLSKNHFKWFDEDNDENDRDSIIAVYEEENELRDLMKNIVKRASRVLGYEHTVMKLISVLAQTCNNLQNVDELTGVIGVEAILYGIKVAIKTVPRSVELDLDSFVKALTQLNYNYFKFNSTKLKVLTVSAKRSEISYEQCPDIFKYLVQQLNGDGSSRAYIAFKVFCANQEKFILDNFDEFRNLYNQKDHDDDIGEGLALAIASSSNVQLISAHLAALCQPIVLKIINSAKVLEQGRDKKALEDLEDNLVKLSDIFDCIDPIESETEISPLEAIFEEIWQYLKAMLIYFQKEPSIVKYLCKPIKRGLKKVGTRFKPVIKEFFEIVAEIFPHTPQPAFLYIIELSASVFNKDEEMFNALNKLYIMICKTIYNFYQENKLGNDHELFEDFFGILFRYAKYIPTVIVLSETLEINMKLALQIIGTTEKSLTKALYLFIEKVFKLSNENPQDQVQTALTELLINGYGLQFHQKLVEAFLEYPPENERENILGVFFAAQTRMRSHAFTWLLECFKQVPDRYLALSEKETLFKQIREADYSDINFYDRDDEDEQAKESDAYSDFLKYFEMFIYRCRQNWRRERD